VNVVVCEVHDVLGLLDERDDEDKLERVLGDSLPMPPKSKQIFMSVSHISILVVLILSNH